MVDLAARSAYYPRSGSRLEECHVPQICADHRLQRRRRAGRNGICRRYRGCRAAIPGAVEDVRIGGTWENDDKSGAYRIIIARTGLEPVTARLFIQWIAYGADGEAVVDHSVEIKELADLSLDIVDYMSESDADGLSVYIDTLNPADGSDETYELHMFSPTEYIFGPATN